MDKLINTFDRGFNLKNDDFRFIDESVRLAFADFVKACVGESSAILWGCEVTVDGTTATVTDGAIYHEDEIWHVSAHTFAVLDPLPAPPYWVFFTSWDADGVKTDKDLQSHNTYQLRRAIGSASTSVSGIVSYVEMPLQTLRELMPDKNTGNVTLVSGVTQVPGIVLDVQRVSGLVTICGKIEAELSQLGAHVATLPSGYRPQSIIRGFYPVFNTTGNTLVNTHYEIGLDGKIKFFIVPGEIDDVTCYIDLALATFRAA